MNAIEFTDVRKMFMIIKIGPKWFINQVFLQSPITQDMNKVIPTIER